MPGLLSGQCLTPCGLRITPVDHLQHAGHLRGGNGNHAVHGQRPDVLPALETLGIKRHADTIMPDDLAEVAAASPENIEIASKGIASETLLHLQGQAAHAAPHVRVPRRDPYPNAGGDWDHGLTDRSTADTSPRSEEHTSELQSLMRNT